MLVLSHSKCKGYLFGSRQTSTKCNRPHLRTLDDKIELNQKVNQTLEEIAKAIFKSWFVDFDPVRAKAEGRPTGLPPEISDLFPDELVDSEIGRFLLGGMRLSRRSCCLDKRSINDKKKGQFPKDRLL